MMKKVLLFHNAAFFECEDDVCVELGTGVFASELKDLGNTVSFYGQILDATPEAVDRYQVGRHGLLFFGHRKSPNKILNYLKLYFGATKQIFRSDFSYFYLPSAFRFLIFICIIFRKKYGIYIRGIDDLTKKESRIFYANAAKIFTVADFFTQYTNGFSKIKNAETIRPMIMFDEHDIVADQKIKSVEMPFKFLYLGRLTDDKGIIELLRAVKILQTETHLHFHLDIVGTGEYAVELQALASELELSESVTFHGPVFDKPVLRNFYVNSHLFILPTYHEGFPRTLYEAMIMRTPILTTFVGGIPGIMKDKINCIEILPHSVSDLVEKIQFATCNYDYMLSLADQASADMQGIFETRKHSHAYVLNQFINTL